MITDEDLKKTLDRIARTPDGEGLYLYFQRVTFELPRDTDPSDSALRANFGRRSLAAELMGLMAKGIAESAGSHANQSADTGGASRGRPVVFVGREPARVSGRESPRDFLLRTDPELAVRKPGGAG